MALEIPLCESPKEDFFKALNQLYLLHDSFKTASPYDESAVNTIIEIEQLIINLQEKYQLGGDVFGNNKLMGDTRTA